MNKTNEQDDEHKGGFCFNMNGGKGGFCPLKSSKDRLCRNNNIYICPGWPKNKNESGD